MELRETLLGVLEDRILTEHAAFSQIAPIMRLEHVLCEWEQITLLDQEVFPLELEVRGHVVEKTCGRNDRTGKNELEIRVELLCLSTDLPVLITIDPYQSLHVGIDTLGNHDLEQAIFQWMMDGIRVLDDVLGRVLQQAEIRAVPVSRQ